MQENTYPIDIESGAETARLLLQDSLLTKTMGGVFPKNYDLSGVKRILDIACGPGGWPLEAAYQYPEIEVVGIDLSQTMINYANTQAEVQQFQNVQFHVMNVGEPLAFQDASFDFINMRFLFSFMAVSTWPSLLTECKRLLRPGGRVRWTEPEPTGTTNSPAYEDLMVLATRAMAAHGLTVFRDGRRVGLTPMMGKFLRDAGFYIVSKQGFLHEASADTEFFQLSCEDTTVTFELVKPYIVKAGLISREEFERLQQQLQEQMLSPDYCSVMCMHSWLAEKPLASC